MAHKKAGGSSRNGRDSNAKRLGVKTYGGESANALQGRSDPGLLSLVATRPCACCVGRLVQASGRVRAVTAEAVLAVEVVAVAGEPVGRGLRACCPGGKQRRGRQSGDRQDCTHSASKVAAKPSSRMIARKRTLATMAVMAKKWSLVYGTTPPHRPCSGGPSP